jgi:hypothetical protein
MTVIPISRFPDGRSMVRARKRFADTRRQIEETRRLAGADPAFDAIDKFLTAELALCRSVEREPPVNERYAASGPEHAVWEVGHAILADIYIDTREAMLRTRPTTRAGAVVLIEAVEADWRDNWNGEPVPEDVLPLLETLKAALPTVT